MVGWVVLGGFGERDLIIREGLMGVSSAFPRVGTLKLFAKLFAILHVSAGK